MKRVRGVVEAATAMAPSLLQATGVTAVIPRCSAAIGLISPRSGTSRTFPQTYRSAWMMQKLLT